MRPSRVMQGRDPVRPFIVIRGSILSETHSERVAPTQGPRARITFNGCPMDRSKGLVSQRGLRGCLSTRRRLS